MNLKSKIDAYKMDIRFIERLIGVLYLLNFNHRNDTFLSSILGVFLSFALINNFLFMNRKLVYLLMGAHLIIYSWQNNWMWFDYQTLLLSLTCVLYFRPEENVEEWLSSSSLVILMIFFIFSLGWKIMAQEGHYWYQHLMTNNNLHWIMQFSDLTQAELDMNYKTSMKMMDEFNGGKDFGVHAFKESSKVMSFSRFLSNWNIIIDIMLILSLIYGFIKLNYNYFIIFFLMFFLTSPHTYFYIQISFLLLIIFTAFLLDQKKSKIGNLGVISFVTIAFSVIYLAK